MSRGVQTPADLLEKFCDTENYGKIKLRGGSGLGFVPEIPEGMSVGAGLELSS